MNGSLEGLVPFLTADTLFFVLKGMYLLAFGLYVLFSVVVVSQIGQMTKTLNGSFDWSIKLLGWLHFGLAVTALLMAVVIL